MSSGKKERPEVNGVGCHEVQDRPDRREREQGGGEERDAGCTLDDPDFLNLGKM